MQSQLAGLVSELAHQTHEVEALVSPLDDHALLRRTTDGRWSIAEHLQHLVLTNGPYGDAIDASVTSARARGRMGKGPFRRGWLMARFIGTMEPPVTRRYRTSRKVVPAPDLVPATVMASFVDAQERLKGSLSAADGVDLSRAKLRSPLFPLLRMSAFEAAELLAAHNRRHIWHAHRVGSEPGGPEGG